MYIDFKYQLKIYIDNKIKVEKNKWVGVIQLGKKHFIFFTFVVEMNEQEMIENKNIKN